jgi:hypothetical protein
MRGKQNAAKVRERVDRAPILRKDFFTSHVVPPNVRLHIPENVFRIKVSTPGALAAGRQSFIPESCHARTNSFSEASGAQALGVRL